MADTYIKFSDLKDTHPSPMDGEHDLLAIAHKDAQTDDYVSMTVTPNTLGSHAVEDMTFSNLKTSSKTVRTAINQTISNLAEDYSSSSTYALNDCVLYEGLLYKCTTAISTPEEWTLAHWTQIKAVDVGSGGGGGGANTWEGTQAEYDAIANPDPDTIYFITDGNPKGGGGIALKTLYNTFNNFSVGTNITLSDSVENYDEIRIYAAYNEQDSGSYYTHRAIVRIDAQSALWSISEQGQGGNFRGWIDFVASFESSSMYVSYCVRFTDTTTLNCQKKSIGSWQAVKTGIEKIVGVRYIAGGNATHNYSADEQVIGTWIDGSSVYEKTIHIQPAGDTSDYTTAEAIQDVDVVIDSSFTAKRVETFGTYYYTGTGVVMPEGVSLNQYKIGVRVSSGNVQYYINGYGVAITDIWATVKYTKTAT